MISAQQRAEWRVEGAKAYQSALWEYCPEEFWTLLDAYEELEARLKHYEDGAEAEQECREYGK